MADKKPCRVCNFTRQKSYGVVVPSLYDLKTKGSEFLGFSATDPVTVVLEDDGTIVADDAYFLCLPPNTKFMLLHEKETWAPVRRMDGGTAWMARDSVMIETDDVDFSGGVNAPWWFLAQQLKNDLASIILMSEEDLQMLVDVPHQQLASAMGFQEKKAQDLQETLQRVLDRRDEERQSKELLQLYLNAVAKEKEQAKTSQARPTAFATADADAVDLTEVDSATGFMSRTLMVLKGKTNPETRLSTMDLQMIVSRGVEAMAEVLGWDNTRTSALLQGLRSRADRTSAAGSGRAIHQKQHVAGQQTADSG
ncbi:hypothetical protein fugu_007452 [Takifugu bimaculatus]|uniref:CIDE-N domain-containing protein n=1 Tax=Takifugu bimaculatus TaxID=433685 RepID=A0A4Z2B4G0_9TELE|nr:hypothetical protein fugu_007452 [Takifugu bimaculatus]